MSLSTRNYLYHINDEIRYIQSVSRNLGKDDFLADETLKRAIVRSLEIIGEAVKQIPSSIRDLHPEIPWRSIARMRDRLIHHYFGIDYDIVWDVLQTHIEPLSQVILTLLAREDI